MFTIDSCSLSQFSQTYIYMIVSAKPQFKRLRRRQLASKGPDACQATVYWPTPQTHPLGLSPGVCLWRFATGSGENLIEPLQRFSVKADRRCPRGALQLLHRAGTDNRRADSRIMQQPSQSDLARRLSNLAAKRFVSLELAALFFDARDQARVGAPPLLAPFPARRPASRRPVGSRGSAPSHNDGRRV